MNSFSGSTNNPNYQKGVVMTTLAIIGAVIVGVLMLPLAIPLLIIMPIILFIFIIEILYLPLALLKAVIVRISGEKATITIQPKEISCDKETETVSSSGAEQHS